MEGGEQTVLVRWPALLLLHEPETWQTKGRRQQGHTLCAANQKSRHQCRRRKHCPSLSVTAIPAMTLPAATDDR